MQAAVWFTSFDLAQDYLQMAMEEANIPKTAFRAGSSSLFEFTCMPFSLTNAGASFCRLMEMVIGDQQFVTLLFYLDDICIFANSADQMLDRIELVFSRLQQYQLKIKPKKSFLFQTEVSFLGHILSAQGISPNLEKVDKVRDWPVPKTSKKVHSFIGLASYYRRFIPNFAKWSKPLNALIMPPAHQAKVCEMKKLELTKFVWSKECQEGFDALKHALTTAPVLAYPDYSQPFILETDASLKGLEQSSRKKAKTEKFTLSRMQVNLFDHLKDPCITIVPPKLNSWHLNGQRAKNLRTIYWVPSLLFLLTTTLWCMLKLAS